MIIEIKTDLEKTREVLKSKSAALKNKMIVRDVFFDKSKYDAGEIIKLRNFNLIFPSNATKCSLSYENSTDKRMAAANDFDESLETLEKLLGKPFVDIVWMGESYWFNNCTVELRSIQGKFAYAVVYGEDAQVNEALKSLGIKYEKMEKGALSELVKHY